MHNWDLIRAFLALHRAGSFEGAAHALSVNHSTLRRRIQALEKSVGAPLFSCKDGRYVLAPAMQPLLAAALKMDVSARVFYESMEHEHQGVVRITMLDFLAHWLAPHLVEFQKLHPRLQLDVTTEHYFVDLETEMIDVAVRLARPTRGRGKLQKVADLQYGIYANRDYFSGLQADARHDILTVPAHFLRPDHDFLVGENAWTLERLPPGEVVFCTDSYLILCRMCEQGAGICLMPAILGDASDSLVRLPDLRGPASCEVWLISHADTGSSPKVRAVLNYLSGVFRQQLLGTVGAELQAPVPT